WASSGEHGGRHSSDVRGPPPVQFKRWYIGFIPGPKRRPRSEGRPGHPYHMLNAAMATTTMLLLAPTIFQVLEA
ncbi:MAG: hypothetical protein V3W34_18770, partial [Phycisphaerae bacterium]